MALTTSRSQLRREADPPPSPLYGDRQVENAGEVLSQWEDIKREVEGRDDAHTELPENLPALLYARKALRRTNPEGSSSGAKPGGPGSDPAERDEAARRVGELLLEAVVLSRRLGVDPELSLRAAVSRL